MLAFLLHTWSAPRCTIAAEAPRVLASAHAAVSGDVSQTPAGSGTISGTLVGSLVGACCHGLSPLSCDSTPPSRPRAHPHVGSGRRPLGPSLRYATKYGSPMQQNMAHLCNKIWLTAPCTSLQRAANMAYRIWVISIRDIEDAGASSRALASISAHASYLPSCFYGVFGSCALWVSCACCASTLSLQLLT